ncbi:Leucine-rich repeat-containing protein [Artemisia annua]|uniref:Leucine-rich repeat-containing protein n=1 Tax=Artemisia annua TaxID=35608 RepID=A0A2U1KP48_ARTAN|nr:Leucine-rich repeat-containing protein [Artemisia annua]
MLQSPILKELNLARTNLSWFKPTYLNVSSTLRLLNHKFTGLNGKWPYNILNLQHLEHLDLYGNSLNGLWPKINTTIPLKSLNLGLNFLSREIPKSVRHLRFLTYWNLFRCCLAGSLPKSIAKLHHLTHIDLAYNKLNGTIPFGLFSLPSLEVFNLHFNKFTGGLPPRVLSRSLKESRLYEYELDGNVNQDSFTHVKSLVLSTFHWLIIN